MKGRKEIVDEFELIAKCANADSWRMYRWPDGSITIKSGENQSGSTYVPKYIVEGGEDRLIQWLTDRKCTHEIVGKVATSLYSVERINAR